MESKNILILLIIGLVVYYFYVKSNEIKIIAAEFQDKNNIDKINNKQEINEKILLKPINIIEPTPFVDPYVDSYYDPYVYSYWDPYDLYPYGIIGVDAGADWNSSYYNYKRPRHFHTHINNPPNNRDNHRARYKGRTNNLRNHLGSHK